MKLKRPLVVCFFLACLLVVIFLFISDNILNSRLVIISSARRNGETAGYQQKCTPATQIVFVKTHKTGSTTTATMLERYGLKHSLVFALPKKSHIFSTTELFSRTMVTKIQRGITLNGNRVSGYNILTNHARYNRPEMDAVIPNAKFVTILREPSAQLESAFAYFNMAEGWGLETTPNALAMFMKSPKAYFEKPFLMSHQSSNGQLFDLGLDHQFHSDRFKVDYKIRQLESEFDLVMILEHYDESLILLKQVLCLEFEDIVYIDKGRRQKQNKYDIRPNLREKMRRWNRDDVKLYNHFNKTLWEKINANREQFDKELKEFRKIQDNVTQKCVEHITLNDGSTKRRIPLNSLKDEVRFCKRIFKGDGHFVKDLRQRYIELDLINPQQNEDREPNQGARNQLQTQVLPACSPATQIVFVKTHKTGSTTIATMLQRYGKSHNLTFALPKIGHLFPIKDLFNRDMVVKIQTGITVNGKTITGYNIITNHARYNRAEMDAVVPNAKFVTILREPVAQLESAFAYFDMAGTLGLTSTEEPLVKFMEKPREYMSRNYTNTSMVHLARNGQLYDLGLEPSLKKYVDIRDKIREIDRGFDLVMIMEYFDESLVLLKNILCLEFDDIVYIAKGSRNDRYKMDPELRKSIRKWNFADLQLYEYFNKSLWNKIQKNREKFDKELMEFRIRQEEVTKLCVEQYYTIDNELRNRIPPNRTEHEKNFCKPLYAGDRNFVRRLRQEYIDLNIFDTSN